MAIFAIIKKRTWVGEVTMGFHLQLSNIKFLQIDGQNWNDKPHSHEDAYQFSIPLKGELGTILDSREKVLTEGESIVANPFSTHGHQIGEQSSSFIIIGFNRNVFNEWARGIYSIKDEIEFSKNQIIFPNDLKLQMRQWISPFLFNNENSNILTHEVENNIFHYFSSILKGSHQTESLLSVDLHVASDVYMNRVLEYIHIHYSEDIKVEMIAELAQQSKFHFIRSFKKLTNTTPYQYILKLRIEKGKELLLLPTKSITEIAFEVGFSSSSQFYRNFIRIVGCTPKQFRD